MRRIALASLAVVLVLATVPYPASAVSYGTFGTLVTASSTDFKPTYTDAGLTPKVVDATGGGGDLSTHALFLDLSNTPTQVDANQDLGLAGTATKGALATTTTSATDLGAFLSNVRYLESDGIMGLTTGDIVVWSLDATLSANDIILSSTVSPAEGGATTGGTVITAGSTLLTSATNANGIYPDSLTLTSATFFLKSFDANGNGALGTGDRLFLTTNTGSTPQVGDIYLGIGTGGTLGTVVTSSDTSYVLSPGAVTAYLGATYTGAGASTDGLWIHFPTPGGTNANLLTNDIILRSAPSTSGAAGSVVTTPSTGQGLALASPATTSLAPLIFYLDVDGTTGYSIGDPVYLNRPSALGGGADAGCATAPCLDALDYRLTSITVGSATYAAGTVVGASDQDLAQYAAKIGNENKGTGVWAVRLFDNDNGGGLTLNSLTNAKFADIAGGTANTWDVATEPVYVSANAVVTSGDKRVYTVAGQPALGTVVCTGTPDADCGRTFVTSPAAATALADFKVSGGDGVYDSTSGEAVYFSKDARVNALDQRLTVLGTLLTGAVLSADADAIQRHVETSDQLFASFCPTGTCQPRLTWNDILLAPTLGTRYGFGPTVGLTTLTTTGFIPTLKAVTLQLIRYDRDPSGGDTTDGFYASNDGTLGTNDLRLVGFSGGAGPGLFVTGSNTEEVSAGSSATSIAANVASLIKYRELDGLTGFTAGDVAYIDLTTTGSVISGASNGVLDLNDIRLSNYPSGGAGGNVVAAGGSETTNSQTGQALTGTFVLAYFDANGDGVFSADDVLYAVPTAIGSTAQVPLNAIYLSGAGGTIGGAAPVSSTPVVTTPNTATSTGTASSSASASSSSSSISPPTTASDGTLGGNPDVVKANQGIKDSLQVDLSGGVAKLTWAQQDAITGYQVWSHNSPYVLLATLNDPSKTSYTDAAGTTSTGYLVTSFHGSDGNLTAAQVNAGQIPGLKANTIPAGAVGTGAVSATSTKAPIPAPGIVVALGAVAVALVLARRRLL